MASSSRLIPTIRGEKIHYFQGYYTTLECFSIRNYGINFACFFLLGVCGLLQEGITLHTEVSIMNFAATLRTEQVHTCK